MEMIELRAPQSYLDASEEVRAAVANGCGPSGWKEKIIPDNIFGTDISKPCEIHDWRYKYGETEEDKVFADIEFLENLTITIINDTDDETMLAVRCAVANTYFIAVYNHGHDAFWAGKDT
jgi:hypothetical protein